MDQALAFLKACADNRGVPLSPGWHVDVGWHAFLLHTREYAEFCHQIAGRFIHHVPTDEPSSPPKADLVDTVAAIIASEPVTGGVNSDFTATLGTAQGRFFCKATRAASRTAWMLRNELAVHPHLPDVAPALHWHVDTGNWLVLGFEHVDGRHPDFSPGSADIAPVLT